MRKAIPLIILVKAFSIKVKEDHVNAFSAQAAFLIILSFFPFIMFLLTLFQYLPFPQDTIIKFCMDVFPDTVSVVITALINEIFVSSSGTILSIAGIVTLWTAGKGFFALVQGMNAIYNIKENRNYIKIRIISMFYTVVFAVLLILLLILFVFGNQLTIWFKDKIPVLNDLALLLIGIRTVVLLSVLVLFFLALYLFMPNRKSTIWKEIPGAVISAGGWVGFSLLYSFYIDNMSNMAATYGSLTAIVLCMLWLYACMYITFIGAEINSVLSNPLVMNAIKKRNLIKKEEKNKESISEIP